MELKIEKLSHSYGEKKALNDFNCTFQPGITALLGPNGAGKTTLISLICDLIKRQEGSITYNGKDILDLGKAFRSVLGFMPQSQGMYEQMTAYEFLMYMAELKGIKKNEAKAQIASLLKTVNLERAAYKKVGGFSGGMKQRVMLTQAMLGSPEVMLLDEPTAGLDPEERVRLREHIQELSKDKIVLITTHITSDVESIADKILLLNKGELLCNMTAEEFTNGSSLEEAYIKRLHENERA